MSRNNAAQIRRYHPEDLPRLKEIMIECFDGVSIDQAIEREFGVINQRDWRWRKSRHLDHDVARDADAIFVAEIAGRVVGFITCWREFESGIGHIPNISVSPECQGSGIGRSLIEYALEFFRHNNLTHAKIETLANNQVGQHLYESIGFKEVTRQIHLAMNLHEG